MAYDKTKLYNHFGKLKFFHNHIALQEAIQPMGNFYIIDKSIAETMDSTIGNVTGLPYGDYIAQGFDSLSETHQKVRDVFTSCNPSYGREFILPSSHGCFEWNLMDIENHSPNSFWNQTGAHDMNPFSTSQIQRNIDTCFIWFDYKGVLDNFTDAEAISDLQWYLEFVYADEDSNGEFVTNVTTEVVWDGIPEGDDGDAITSGRIDSFLGGAIPETVDINGTDSTCLSNSKQQKSNILGFSWIWPDDSYGVYDTVLKIRLCYKFADGITATGERMLINGIWLGKGIELPIAPDIRLSHSMEHDGIKRKKSISGKQFTNVEYFGSPSADVFNRDGAFVTKDFRGNPSWQNAASYISNSNLGRKKWEFSLSSCPAQYLFPATDTVSLDGFNHWEMSEIPQFTPDGLSPSYAIIEEGSQGTDSNGMRHYNLMSLVRLSANGMIPLIFCQDWENRELTGAEYESSNPVNEYNNKGNMLNPAFFHIVRFEDYPKFDRITDGFWDTSFSLEESW